jgi:hypothetical protein
MVREDEASNPEGTAILCDIINRGDPCRIRVTVLAKDMRGRSCFAMALDSDSVVGRGGKATLKKQLVGAEAKVGGLIASLKIGDPERRNVQHEARAQERIDRPEKVREQKIRSLKEAFLKDVVAER